MTVIINFYLINRNVFLDTLDLLSENLFSTKNAYKLTVKVIRGTGMSFFNISE